MVPALLQYHVLTSSNQRGEELRAKSKKAIEEALGDRINEVINLQILATSPVLQGRGYGSALVRTITGIVCAV